MKRFKGGDFQNRYKIVGTLTTLSPLHIGDGEMDKNQERLSGKDDVPEFQTVARDVGGHAYIPGSTLKGCLRSWLSQIFSGIGLAHVNTAGRAKGLQKHLEAHKGQGDSLHQVLTTLEYLFGSNMNEGKLEFWDAGMVTPPPLPAGSRSIDYCGYSESRGTIVLKSVAINPETGTAAENRLFNYEVVPKGACFTLTVCGQNLFAEELGMLLFALEGFNSIIYPVTLGGMTGVGFGCFKFVLQDVHCLNEGNLKNWIEEAVKTGHAGYTSIPVIEKKDLQDALTRFGQSFLARVGGGEKS